MAHVSAMPPDSLPGMASTSSKGTSPGKSQSLHQLPSQKAGSSSQHNGFSHGSNGASSTHTTGSALAARRRHRRQSGSGDEKEEKPIFQTVFLGKQRAVLRVEPRYGPQEVIGAGAYGIVCSAEDYRTGDLCAVKKIENTLEHRSLAKRTLRELIFLRLFNHENIMGLRRVMRPTSRKFKDVYLVTELMETDLACVIRSPQQLTDDHVQFFIYQVLRGMKSIHSANVVHRDLKPRNLLVNSNCDLKICDFGLARYDDPRTRDKVVMSEYIATRWYRAPEVILCSPRYSLPVDVWAIGCILGELIGRSPMFPGENSVHQLALIHAVTGLPPSSATTRANLMKRYPEANPLAVDLLVRCLEYDPDKRITVEEALKHPYLEELHDESDEPTCDTVKPGYFFFENKHLSKEELRLLIYHEMVDNYPVDRFVPPAGQVVPPPVEKHTSARKGKRRVRRKSF